MFLSWLLARHVPIPTMRRVPGIPVTLCRRRWIPTVPVWWRRWWWVRILWRIMIWIIEIMSDRIGKAIKVVVKGANDETAILTVIPEEANPDM
ncbi:hypothetical protein SLEP1_g48016 [Rubroshorea leprosula]|uniref:Uncharacterized protein n=1 Tax=Rubroshorea leprosula TaxID=152421 RepID=A0AAV5LUL4_9ROSI|nr:hypothetical protein SLEP1_g48016 [Rubroshorea leprosula]